MSTDTTCICAHCGETGPADALQCAACGDDPKLRGRYTLERIVGHGAVGTTYRARDGLRGEVVAVKEMPLRPTTPAEQITRMEREARVLGELRHAQIPDLVDHFAHGAGKHRAFYVVQQFVDGQTLDDEIKRKRYTEDEVLAVLDEICVVLDYLHALAPPVVHRDLKPKNLIRRPDGTLALIDFGAVRDVVADPALGGSTVAGTYGYMAPEGFRGASSPQSDLYAVGAIAVRMLSRRDLIDLVGVDHRLDYEGAVHASPPTRELLARLLAQDPEDRPESAREVRRLIARIRDGEPLRATPEPARAPVLDLPPVPARPTELDPATRKRMGAREKKWVILLGLIGGFWGVHNIYLQRYVRFFLSFIFAWTFIPLIVSLITVARVAFMSPRDFDLKYNPELMEYARGDTFAVAEQIRALHELVETGALTEDEFQQQKAILLQQRAPNTFARLGTDALRSVFDHFEARHDISADLADAFKHSRRRVESFSFSLGTPGYRRDRSKRGKHGKRDRIDQLSRDAGHYRSGPHRDRE